MTHLIPSKVTRESIASISNLAATLDISESDLLEVEKIPYELRYRKFPIPKGNGGERDVYDAIPKLRNIQHRINTRIFKKLIKWPKYLYGALPNDVEKRDGKKVTLVQRDYMACALNHCEAKSILKLDVTNFFESIHRDRVMDIFYKFFSFPEEVSAYLTEICCYGNTLVQGALTSSYLATLCLWDVEWKVVQKLHRRDLVYTRLVDDITVSSKFKGYNFSNAESHIKKMMLESDFSMNLDKTITMRIGAEPLLVHGLIVDFATPRLPSSEVSRIRASVQNVVKAASVNNYRTTFTYRAQYFRCLGRVNRLARVNHNKHAILIEKLRRVRPRPCMVDGDKVRNLIIRLNGAKDKTNDSYRRIYYIARYRIEIVSRSFLKESETLKAEFDKLAIPTPKFK